MLKLKISEKRWLIQSMIHYVELIDTRIFCDDQVNDSIVTIAVFIYYCNLQRSLIA